MKAKKRPQTWTTLRIKPKPCEFAFVGYINDPEMHKSKRAMTEKIVPNRGSTQVGISGNEINQKGNPHVYSAGSKLRYARCFLPDKVLAGGACHVRREKVSL